MKRMRPQERFPLEYLESCLKLGRWAESGLEWSPRPRSHFKNRKAFNIWNAKYARRRAGTKIKRKGYPVYWQVRLDGRSLQAHKILQRLLDSELDRREGKKPPREPVRHDSKEQRRADWAVRRLEKERRSQRCVDTPESLRVGIV